MTANLRPGTPMHLYLPGPHRGVWNEVALEASKEIILCESLIDALAEKKRVRVDLELSGPWDLAGFQLLISAVASGRKAGLPVTLANVPRVCCDVADRAGLAAWLKEAAESFQ